jgi:hypothetical protein
MSVYSRNIVQRICTKTHQARANVRADDYSSQWSSAAAARLSRDGSGTAVTHVVTRRDRCRAEFRVVEGGPRESLARREGCGE